MAGLNGIKCELTQQQLQVLKNEIDSDSRYASVTRGGIVKLINEPPLIDNPVACGKVNAPDRTLAEITIGAGWSPEELAAIRADAEGVEILKILETGVSLTNATVIGYLDRLQTLNLLSPEKIQAAKDLGEIDDPNYQAQIQGLSRTEEILGVGYKIEGANVKAALML